MYLIRKEKALELKDGRKITDLAEIIGVSKPHLSSIFSRKLPCKKSVTLLLISLKEHIPINATNINDLIDYYFTREED